VCYNVLENNIDNTFKVSNDPALVCWNPTMDLCEVLDQMMATYGHPTPVALLHNDTLFRSIYSPQDAPKVLFQRSEDYQEVQILGEDPYSHLSSCSTMKYVCCYSATCIPVDSTIGTANLPQKRFGPTSRRSFKKCIHTV
jgi:hypothetical protein